MRTFTRLLQERTDALNSTFRDWLTIDALESVLLSFFKGGSTLQAQPIPILSPPPRPPLRSRVERI